VDASRRAEELTASMQKHTQWNGSRVLDLRPWAEDKELFAAINHAYGYRAWGPNWSFDPTWTKGSGSGFHRDVDPQGNRFNPNKLLLDPYALDVSHDPVIPTSAGQQTDGRIYQSGAADRSTDTGAPTAKMLLLSDLFILMIRINTFSDTVSTALSLVIPRNLFVFSTTVGRIL
jgi:pullulanase/glycogen debranching enzyme